MMFVIITIVIIINLSIIYSFIRYSIDCARYSEQTPKDNGKYFFKKSYFQKYYFL